MAAVGIIFFSRFQSMSTREFELFVQKTVGCIALGIYPGVGGRASTSIAATVGGCTARVELTFATKDSTAK